MGNNGKGKAKVGRPRAYTKLIATEVCDRLADGESLRQICKDKHLPSIRTVMRWLLDKDYEEFWQQYAKAREMQAEVMFEEIIEICDDGSNDWMERETEKGRMVEVVNHEHIARSRLRVDTRKWYLSKVLPKKFADNNPVNITNVVRVEYGWSDKASVSEVPASRLPEGST